MKLKLQYFGHLMRRADLLEKTLMLGKIEGRRRRGRQDKMVGWHCRLNGHEFEQTPGDGKGQGRPNEKQILTRQNNTRDDGAAEEGVIFVSSTGKALKGAGEKWNFP